MTTRNPRRSRHPRALLAVLTLVLVLVAPQPAAYAATAQASPRDWTWPLGPRPAVVRQFDPPSRPWLSGHRGVDLAGAPGAGIRAPSGGTVVFSGWVVDRPVLTVDHGNGLRSSFEPVAGTVSVGAAVAKGQEIGTLAVDGAGHCTPGGCLHWGVRRGEEYLDPLSFIEDRRPSVLLPWT